MSKRFASMMFLCGFLTLDLTAIEARALYTDASQPISTRVDDLISRLTVAEKIQQTYTIHTGQSTVLPMASKGVGSVKFMSAFKCEHDLAACVVERNALQAKFMDEGRHGIPISFVNEGLHGGAPTGTIFPMPVGQGCSWNSTLVHSIATVIAAEASAIGVDVVFAPVVNMMTDPRFGRLQEGYSENPTLTSRLAEFAVRGLQGCAPNSTASDCGPRSYLKSNGVAALGKHYAAYGAASGGLNGGPAAISNRTLHDIYLRPWKSMADVGLRACMPSHNSVLDIPAHASSWLLNGVLREQFGFEGVALSDCNDIGVIYDFRMAVNRTHGAALGLVAGVDWDLQCGTDPEKWSYNKLQDALDKNLFDESVLDAAVRNVLRLKFANGLFDGRATVPGTRNEIKARLNALLDSPRHRALAREAAQQSIVMLIRRTSSELPWRQKHPKQVALIGPTASSQCNCSDAQESLFGGYTLSPEVKAVTLDVALATAGIRTVWAGAIKTSGGAPLSEVGLLVQDQVAISSAADAVNDEKNEAVIVLLGDLSGKACGEWGDRDDLTLQGAQLPLLKAVIQAADARAASGKPRPPVIVLLVHGRPQTFGPGSDAPGGLLSKVDAMFAAWRPGEEFGNAIMDLLRGDANPSGKLAHSWPRTVGHVHSGSSPWLQPVTGKWIANERSAPDPDGRVYDSYAASQYADATPLFGFGFGLSYSSFSYSDLRITSAQNDLLWQVSFTISNHGDLGGSEIAQVYVEDPWGLPFVPYWKRLVGFSKVYVDSHSSEDVVVDVRRDDVAQYSADNEPVLTLYQGTYNVSVGGGPRNPLLAASVDVSRADVLKPVPTPDLKTVVI